MSDSSNGIAIKYLEGLLGELRRKSTSERVEKSRAPMIAEAVDGVEPDDIGDEDLELLAQLPDEDEKEVSKKY